MNSCSSLLFSRSASFVGTGEKVDALEEFDPERIAGRILGMGDVLTLIEKAEALEEAAEDGGASGRPQDFSLADMLHQMRQLKKMGSFGEILGMIPGAKKMMPAGADVDEGELARVEAILSSMTDAERTTPRLLDASRRRRIARGSGTTVQDVNRLIKNYEATKKMMKKASKPGRLPAGFGG